MEKVNTFCKMIRTLEYYGYGEMNAMTTPMRSYKVKVSDKDGNIITIEKDGSLFAMVGLALNGGVLSLLDAAHENSVLAEVEFPNAGHIENTRFDSGSDKILFDITTLNGNVETIELDVQSLVDIYEEGQGIEFKDGSKDGKKTINIKLAEGEDILQLGDEGLSLSDKIATDEEVDEKLESKADKSGLTEVSDELEKLKRVVGTDVEDPSIKEQIDEINEALDNLSGITVDLSGITAELDKKADKVDVEALSGTVDDLTERVETVESGLSGLAQVVIDNEMATAAALNDLNDKKADKSDIEALSGLSGNVADMLAEEKRERIAADNVLSGLISDEASARAECCEAMAERIASAETKISDVSDRLTQEIERATGAENSLSGEISTERAERIAADDRLNNLLTREEAARKAEDEILRALISGTSSSVTADLTDLYNRLAQEIQDRISGDTKLGSDIATEKTERERDISANKALIQSGIASVLSSVTEVSAKVDREAETRAAQDADIREALRQEISNRETGDNNLHAEVVAEAQIRENADNALNQRITDELRNYYTKAETDARIAEDVAEGVNNAVSQSNLYTDNKTASAITEAERYTDNKYNDLTSAITKNATNIAMISELKGTEGGVEGYDNSGNGILDVLHREFHDWKGSTVPTAIGGITMNNHDFGEVTVGRYNETRREQDTTTGEVIKSGTTVFSVGIGNGNNQEDRKNGMELRADGRLYLWVEGEYMCVNELLEQIAHETYYDGSDNVTNP